MFFPASIIETSFLWMEILNVNIAMLPILNQPHLHFFQKKKYTTPQTETDLQELEIAERRKWTFTDHVLCAIYYAQSL